MTCPSRRSPLTEVEREDGLSCFVGASPASLPGSSRGEGSVKAVPGEVDGESSVCCVSGDSVSESVLADNQDFSGDASPLLFRDCRYNRSGNGSGGGNKRGL